MTGNVRFALCLLFVGFCLSECTDLAAQELAKVASLEEPRDESLYYKQPEYRPDTRAIIHQKAQERAYQRQARLSSTAWYGMYNARPTAAPTPFTSLYSPVWQMPGGRPYAWHTRTWPTYAIYVR